MQANDYSAIPWRFSSIAAYLPGCGLALVFLAIGLGPPAPGIFLARLGKSAAAGIGHVDDCAGNVAVAETGVAALGRHFAEAAQGGRNEVVKSLADQFAPAFSIAEDGGAMFAAAVAGTARRGKDGLATLLGSGWTSQGKE